ncbi:MFS transporter [Pelistega sp. MC2]|uniref:MFS transporter n=1 Tax=Pelistega sp. MC2 TaxID=1720297 RepID=UPI0008D9FE77|nr:MFS transporter [Pelistega sp. MC2]
MSHRSYPSSTYSQIRSLIDGRSISRFQWKIIAICFCIVLLDGFDIAIVAYIAPLLKTELSLGSQHLSYLFMSGVLGLMLGSMIFGSLADKFGRKSVLLVSMLLYGVSTSLCGLVGNIDSLIFLRFITGLGLGGAMPVSIALCAEYSPEKHRMLLCTLGWSGFTVGIAAGGFFSNFLLEQLSWSWLFYIGGVLPLLSMLVVLKELPESLEYLVRIGDNRKLSMILKKINLQMNDIVPSKENMVLSYIEKVPTVRCLFTRDNILLTLLLWVAFFFSLMVFYLLTYWIPLLFDELYSLKEVNVLTAMIPLGGTVGAFILAVFIDRKKAAFLILAISYLASFGLLLFVPSVSGDYYSLLICLFFIGFTIAGAQNGLNLVSATIYQAYARATGVGWAMSSGRLGSIVGSYIGALLAQNSIETFFNYLSIGGVVCSMALLGIFLYRKLVVI